MKTVSLKIDGMHCEACVSRVRRALERVADVKVHEVAVGSAKIQTPDVDAAIAAVGKAGYPAARA
jgi:copper chaperone CopZ